MADFVGSVVGTSFLVPLCPVLLRATTIHGPYKLSLGTAPLLPTVPLLPAVPLLAPLQAVSCELREFVPFSFGLGTSFFDDASGYRTVYGQNSFL